MVGAVGGDAKMAVGESACAPEQDSRLVLRCKKPCRDRKEVVADRGQSHSASAAVEKIDRMRHFQRANLGRKGRLADPACDAGPRETALAGHLMKGMQ